MAPLTWSLVVCTYRREEVLRRSLTLGVNQTRAPREIVVVDAGPEWLATRDWVLHTLAPAHPEVSWIYVQAIERSLTVQRNQGAAIATSDVLFMFDDDSLMYPDCAERIMQVYEADVDGAVVGVNAVHVGIPPDRPDEVPDAKYGTTKHHSALVRLVRRLLSAEDVFIPYDGAWPKHCIPAPVARLNVDRWLTAGGWGMTYRRAVVLREPFDPILAAYAACEDTDMSYRASRHGVYLGCNDARLCHIGARGGRLHPRVVSTLQGLNTLVLHRLNTTDVEHGRRSNRRLLLRRAAIALLKDLRGGRLALPEARGWLRSVRMVDTIFDQAPAGLRAWYPAFQQELIDSGAA